MCAGLEWSSEQNLLQSQYAQILNSKWNEKKKKEKKWKLQEIYEYFAVAVRKKNFIKNHLFREFSSIFPVCMSVRVFVCMFCWFFLNLWVQLDDYEMRINAEMDVEGSLLFFIIVILIIVNKVNPSHCQSTKLDTKRCQE